MSKTHAIAGTVAELKKKMIVAKTTAESFKGFQVNPGIVANWNQALRLFEEKKHDEAAKMAESAIGWVYSGLTKFIRLRVLGESFSRGISAPGRFEMTIRDRMEQNFDPDLISMLQSKFRKLEHAVKEELSGTFKKRVEAFNEFVDMVDSVDRAQAQRDQKRQADKFLAKKVKKGGGQQGKEDPSVVAKRQAALEAERVSREAEAQAQLESELQEAASIF